MPMTQGLFGGKVARKYTYNDHGDIAEECTTFTKSSSSLPVGVTFRADESGNLFPVTPPSEWPHSLTYRSRLKFITPTSTIAMATGQIKHIAEKGPPSRLTASLHIIECSARYYPVGRCRRAWRRSKLDGERFLGFLTSRLTRQKSAVHASHNRKALQSVSLAS